MLRRIMTVLVAGIGLQAGFGQENLRLTLRAKVTELGLQTGSFARNKKPQDTVQVTLAGHKVAPARAVPLVSKTDARWASPELCVDSIRSANMAGDAAWIVENFAPSDQADVRKMLNDPDIAKRNQDYYKRVSKAEVIALVEIREYRVVVVREETGRGKAVVVPIPMAKTPAGWKQTNALSKDEIYDVVWAAVRGGGIE